MKHLIDTFFTILWEPFNLLFILSLKFSQFHHISFFLSLIPFRFGMIARSRFYKKTLSSCGENLQVYYGAIITYQDISIGDNVRIGPYNIISMCSIGNNVIMAQQVNILSGSNQHSFESMQLIKDQEGTRKTVTLGDNIWVGAGAIIMNDIQSNSIVGAGSIVIKPLKENGVYAGNPAKKIKDLI